MTLKDEARGEQYVRVVVDDQNSRGAGNARVHVFGFGQSSEKMYALGQSATSGFRYLVGK
jgi:hypothetical protein